MDESNFCYGCNEVIMDSDVENGGTRKFGVNTYHKECYKKIINSEHDKINSRFNIRKIFKKPRFTVAWWTPFFWMFIGMFYFIGNVISLNFFKNIIVYNETMLIKVGTTSPPIVTWLVISSIVSGLMIAYGAYLFNHTEEEID